MPSKPNVLIFGALEVVTPALVKLLVPPLPAEPLVSHIRIIDRYSVKPPTTFLPKAFLQILEDRNDVVEYRQGNLANPAVVARAFNDPAPNGQLYSYVMDGIGELTPGRPLEVNIRNSFEIPVSIARAAAALLAQKPGCIKSYIRCAPPWYHQPNHKKLYKEVDPDGWRPRDSRGVWWHEMLRAVGSIEGLPLVVLRCGMVYGEGFSKFERLILLGLVYRHLGQEMKLLWSPELPKTSINIIDMAGIIWKTFEWMSTKTRREAEELAGAALPPSNDPAVNPSNAPAAIPASAGSVTMPVFNVVDEGNSTQGSVSEVIAKVYGIKVGFHGKFKGWLATKNLWEVSSEANEFHLQAWNEIILHSHPPVPETPLSPFMPASLLEEHAYCFDGERIKTILQYKFKYPRFQERAVRDYINWCRSEGIWPETKLYTAT